MGMEKAIESGKEHRKPYYHSGKFDLTCRPHGGCPWCRRNREHAWRKREPLIEEEDLLIEEGVKR